MSSLINIFKGELIMSNIVNITKPGDYGRIAFMGGDRNRDIGLTINVWGKDNVVNIRSVEIGNCFVPILIQGDAEVIIEDNLLYLFGGDAMNIRGSNNKFRYTNIEGNTPTRPYKKIEVKPGYTIERALYEAEVVVYDPSLLKTYVDKRDGKVYIEYYHQDAVQMYATPKGGYYSTENDVLENVTFENINVQMKGSNSQGISLTEKCGYNNIHVGTLQYNVQVDYYYSLIATNLNNFTLGNYNNVVTNKPVRLQQPKGKESKYWFYDGHIMLPGEHQLEEKAVNIKQTIPHTYRLKK